MASTEVVKFYAVEDIGDGRLRACFDCPMCGHHLNLGVYPVSWWTAIGCKGCKKMIPHPAHTCYGQEECYCPDLTKAEFIEKHTKSDPHTH